MGHESRYFDATDQAKQFVKDHIAIDALMAPLVHQGGLPRDDMFEEYHDRAIETGIDLIGLTAAAGADSFETTTFNLGFLLKHINASNGRYKLVRNISDLQQVHERGIGGLFFNAQGCECLNNNPKRYMPLLKELGFGTMLLAYNERYRSGDGCMVKDPAGLNLYGTQVIDAMHENRVIVDLSHAANITALQIVEYSQRVAPDIPVIFTHGIPDKICNYYRSSSDEAISACASTGGVFALTMLPWLMNSPTGRRAQETTPHDAADALDYLIKLIGVDHVGMSSDDTYSWPGVWKWAATVPEMYQDGGITMQAATESPTGSAEPAKIYPAIVDALWDKGYSDESVRKVLGGNLMRVFEQVWGGVASAVHSL